MSSINNDVMFCRIIFKISSTRLSFMHLTILYVMIRLNFAKHALLKAEIVGPGAHKFCFPSIKDAGMIEYAILIYKQQ